MAVYSAYTRDNKIRWNSTSGGVVSTLVAELLKSAAYERAYVVKYDNFDGGQAKLAAITDPKDVLPTAKSKYIPVSVEAVVEAVRRGSVGGSIVVCTPCQLRAIRKAMAHYGVSDEKVLFVGIFCQSMFNYNVYARYEKDYGPYDRFFFREKEPNGWPGDTTLVKNGERRKIDRKVRMSLKKDYPMPCCSLCTDKLNEDADISVGDCYIPGFSMPDGVRGVSSVIIRTKRGEGAFEACRGSFISVPVTYDRVRLAQKTVPSEEFDVRVYNVCINIIGIRNRGQDLMFESILEQVRGRIPNALVFVDIRAFREDSAYFRKRRVLPLLDPHDIDLLFHEPGFLFSDSFVRTPSRIDEHISYFKSFDKPGRKVIFLPQAFGPFEREDTRRLLLGSCACADLVFARDKESLRYLKGIFRESPKLELAPDFTCLFHASKKGAPPIEGSYVVVVPNVKMLIATDKATSAAYGKFSREALSLLLAAGERVVLLNHSGEDDRMLIDELNATTGGRCLVLDGLSGLDCKAVLANAKLVISSRYHALVSALTEGRPALSTSWSHKYQELVGDLGVPMCCLDVRNTHVALGAVRDALAQPATYMVDAGRLEALRASVYRMWDRIFGEVPAWAEKSSPVDRQALSLLFAGDAERLEKLKKMVSVKRERLHTMDEQIKTLKSVLKNRDLEIRQLQQRMEG